MSGLWARLASAAARVALGASYDNRRGRLRPEKIDAYLGRVEASGFAEQDDIETPRSFLPQLLRRAGHPFKAAALPNTFAFQTRSTVALYAGPLVRVPLGLALIAALTRLAVAGLARPRAGFLSR